MPTKIDDRSIWVRIGPLIVASAASLSVLVLVSVAVLDNISDHLIRQQAERESIAWAGYIGSSVDRIEDIAKGSEPTESERAFLSRLQQFGNTFRYKIFDPEGNLRLNSENLAMDKPGNDELGQHNPIASRVLSSGKPYAEVHDGSDLADRPDIFVEAYVPIYRDGRIVAISEVYVDQTETSTLIKEDFAVFGVIIAGLTLLVLLVPLWALRLLTVELQMRNHDLDTERARAVEAENAKSAFLAHMSHELRTPLNAIQGLSEMMIRGDLGKLDHPKYLEYSLDINFSAAHLLKLVNDILDLSKIDAGKFELVETELDLHKSIDEALRIARAWPGANDLLVHTEFSENRLLTRADERAIKQILLNLLSNAAKFTHAGGEIRVMTGIDAAGNGVVMISDTGLGIPEKDLKRILEPFSQLHRPAALQQEGTGLGLSLVKSMIELHGGTLTIHSKEGEGTTVTVTIPAERMIQPDKS